MFIFRNNLTVLDGIVVQGQGARGEFTLNGKRPGSHSTLLFEIKPNQLVDCHSKFLCSGLKFLITLLSYCYIIVSHCICDRVLMSFFSDVKQHSVRYPGDKSCFCKPAQVIKKG